MPQATAQEIDRAEAYLRALGESPLSAKSHAARLGYLNVIKAQDDGVHPLVAEKNQALADKDAKFEAEFADLKSRVVALESKVFKSKEG